MDRATFRQFKSLLLSLPPWTDVSTRLAFLDEVFVGHRLMQQFNAGGPGDVAASELVKLLGALESRDIGGMTPACALLREIRAQFGAGQEREETLSQLERTLDCRDNAIRSVLFLAASPEDKNLDLLRTDKEFMQIRAALDAPGNRAAIKLHLPELALQPNALSSALHRTRPSIVHFAGHGAGRNGIYFEDAQGHPRRVPAEALASVFRLFADQVKVVVLNACFSRPQAEAIATHIDVVIGTREAIGDDTAIAFSVGFYRALAAGWSLEKAFQSGCAENRMADIPEHAVPVLIAGPGNETGCAG